MIKEDLQSQRVTPVQDILINHLPELLNDQDAISSPPTPQYAPSTLQMHHASSSTNSSTNKTHRQWEYYNRLLRVLFDQGLIERQSIVEWIVDAFIDRIRHNDDQNLLYLTPIVFQFSNEILEYEIFSRKIAYYCCKRLGQYHTDITQPVNFTNHMSCPQHRILIYSLSAIIQCVTLRCPAALLYNNPVDDQQKSEPLVLNYGSPLDFLSCSPSELPLPIGIDQKVIKEMLIQSEHEIRSRSLAIEHKWSTEKLQQSVSSQTISRALAVMEVLDEFKEEKYLLDNIYNKIYDDPNRTEPINVDMETEMIHLMCDWAITTRRHGVHRAFFIARLLERRQNELKNIHVQQFTETIDEKDSTIVTSSSLSNTQINPFQAALIEYLMKKVSFIDDNINNNFDMNASFPSLVMLFSEFIRLHLFSPMQFMCNLVANGLTENHENTHPYVSPTNHLVYQEQQPAAQPFPPMYRSDSFMMESSFDRRFDNPLIVLDRLEIMKGMKKNRSSIETNQSYFCF